MPDDTGGDNAVVEVEFVVDRADSPFARVAEERACTIELAAIVPRPGNHCAVLCNVSGGDPAEIAASTTDRDPVRATRLREYEDGGLLEVLVSGRCPVVSLAELGALPRAIRSVDARGLIVAEIPPPYDPSAVIEEFLAEHPGTELATKREKAAISPLFTESTFQQVVRTRLTDRQHEVLWTAFEAGYYEWPRECTGEEVAAELGISSATFSEHIAAAERKLLAVTFEERA